MNNWPNPFIEQRADPFILRHLSHYYFIASVPEYDRLEIRRAVTLEGLRDAEPVVVWRAPQSGPMSQLIWAPELHEIDDKWYIYFAATHTHDLDALGMFQHRMFVLECADSDPLTGRWQEKGGGHAFRYLRPRCHHFYPSGETLVSVGAKSPHIEGNSNLYLAEMANPWTLKASRSC